MKGKFWLNAALLAAVAALALLAWFNPGAKSDEHRLSLLKAGDVNNIQLRIGSAQAAALKRIASDWMMTAPLATRADNAQVQRLLDILQATSRDRYAPIGLARYGLNEPAASITINNETFSFGAINEMSREQYVGTKDGVYLVPLRYGAALPRSPLQLVSKQIFSADDAPVAFSFREFQVAGENGKWQLTPPTQASADDIQRWVDEWRLAMALNVLPPSHRKPLQTISIKLKNGASLAVHVLQQEPALVLARSDRDYEYQFAAAATRRLLAPPQPAPGN